MKYKYNIESMTNNGSGVWNVVFYAWQGCACNKKKYEGEIISERMPTLAQVIELHEILVKPM